MKLPQHGVTKGLLIFYGHITLMTDLEISPEIFDYGATEVRHVRVVEAEGTPFPTLCIPMSPAIPYYGMGEVQKPHSEQDSTTILKVNR